MKGLFLHLSVSLFGPLLFEVNKTHRHTHIKYTWHWRTLLGPLEDDTRSQFDSSPWCHACLPLTINCFTPCWLIQVICMYTIHMENIYLIYRKSPVLFWQYEIYNMLNANLTVLPNKANVSITFLSYCISRCFSKPNGSWCQHCIYHQTELVEGQEVVLVPV